MLDTLLTFRRSKFTSRWCAFGPVELLKVNAVVRVHHADGFVLKKITSVSKAFNRGGEAFAYAHLIENDICTVCKNGEIPRGSDSDLCPVCALEDLGLLK